VLKKCAENVCHTRKTAGGSRENAPSGRGETARHEQAKALYSFTFPTGRAWQSLCKSNAQQRKRAGATGRKNEKAGPVPAHKRKQAVLTATPGKGRAWAA
jgi:hypothetical protein